MIVKEISVERFSHSCARCGTQWVEDYDVQHVEDGHGHDHDYFFRNGVYSPDPTDDRSTPCPSCASANVKTKLIARRTTPAAGHEAPVGTPSRPSQDLTAQRRDAAQLPHD